MVANDQDPTPFVTFVSAKTRSVLGKLPYPQVVFGGKVHGLEQPVWDGVTRRFYLAVPGTTKNPNGEVDEINPRTMTITRAFAATCAPAGLAVLPQQRLITSCGDVLRISTGAVLTTVPGVAADEIWYNSGDDRVYFARGTTFTAVNAQNYTKVASETLTTVTGASTHSVAADSETNRITIPVSHVGLEIWTDQTRDDDDPGDD